MYLVNMVLPVPGTKISIKDYMATLARLGYSRYRQLGSIGGGVKNGVLLVSNGMVLRLG